MHSKKKRSKSKRQKINAFKHAFSFIKFTQFHAFIYALFKSNHSKKNQVSCIHKYILKKNRKGKNKVACIQTCIFIQNKIKKIKVLFICVLFKKEQK